MAYFESEAWVDRVDQLAENDYVVVDNFIPNQLYSKIEAFYHKRLAEDNFAKAGIGALNDYQIVETIRGDFVYWLNKDNDAEIADFFVMMEEFVQFLNRTCFLSLSGFEFHLAYYPQNTYYQKHLDQFKKRNNRLISVVLYLNQNWKKGDGGELKIYQKEGGEVLIEPIANRCVFFRSDIVPHEVLKTNTNRKSVTGWLLYQPPTLGFLLG